MAHPSSHKPKTPKAPKAPKLSPGQQQQAMLDQTLYNPTEILSGANLRNSVNAQVEGTIKPQLDAANRGIATATNVGAEQQRRAKAYFDQLASQHREAIDLQQALGERSQGRQNMYAQAATNRIQDAGSQAVDQMNQDQSVRGAGLEGGARAQFAADQAARVGAQGLATQVIQGEGQNQSDNYAGLLNTLANSSKLKAGEVSQGLANQTASTVNDLIGKRADVAASRGSLREQLANKLRDSEFQKFATIQGLGIKQSSIDEQAKAAAARVAASLTNNQNSNATSLANNQNNNNTSLSNNAATNLQRALDRAQRKGDNRKARKLKKQLAALGPASTPPGTDKSGKPTAGNLKAQSQIRAIAANYRQGLANGFNMDQLAAAAKKKYDPLYVSAGAQLAVSGMVSAPVRRNLANAGVTNIPSKAPPGFRPAKRFPL